jgi:hypothetical protein
MANSSWATLLEVSTRIEAEIIQEALEAQGIPAALFQEGVAHLAFPMNAGPLAQVEIGVPNERLAEAQAWLAEYENGQLVDPDTKGEPGQESDAD